MRSCQAKYPLHHGGTLQCYLATKHRGMHEVAVDTTSGVLMINWASEYKACVQAMAPADPLENRIGVA